MMYKMIIILILFIMKRKINLKFHKAAVYHLMKVINLIKVNINLNKEKNLNIEQISR
jgi:hypothetical protein